MPARIHHRCTIDGCSAPHKGLGLCSKHYQRLKKFGDPLIAEKPKMPIPFRKCIVDGCDRDAKSLSMCRLHRGRLQRQGQLGIPGTEHGAPLAFVAQAAAHQGKEECLLWPFVLNSQGYGAIRIGDRKWKRAHREVCKLAHGPSPVGKPHVAHSCGNRLCVNPNHIRWASHLENMRDKIGHGTSLRGESQCWSKLTEDNVREIRALRGKVTQPELAQKFGVTVTAVWSAQVGRTWAWLE